MAQNKKAQMAHVINLVSIANLDGKITEEEKQLLMNIANSLGLTEEEFELCVKTGMESTNKVIYVVPETDEEKTFYLKNLTTMMMIDGQIDKNEKQYIKVVAEKFGYDGDKALEILMNSVYEDFRKVAGNKKAEASTVQTSGSKKGEPTTKQTSGNQTMSDEEFKKETRRLTALGKEALQKHDISKAFDYLLLPAHVDSEAMNLFLMIPNTHTRLYLLSKEQIEQVKHYAEKGYALSQYVYGRCLQILRPDDKAIDEAIKYFDLAIKAGVPDALCAMAYLIRDGHCGPVDREKVKEMINQAFEHNSMLANRKYCMRYIYGQDGYEVKPQFIIDSIKNMLNGDESDDISKVNPMYYDVLGDAYTALDDKEKAENYYMKAIEMGYNEAYGGYCSLHSENNDSELLQDMYLTMLDLGCSQDAPDCYVYKAAFLMDHYDEYDEEKQKATTPEIKECLETASKLGNDIAPYFLGNAYYYGYYGFEEDNTDAWNWFIEGIHREDSYAFSMVAQMIIDETTPEKVSEGLLEFCQLNALRHGDDDQLRNVVEAYRSGKLTYAAAEIEKYYIPEYEALPEEDEEEDEEDDDEEEYNNGEDGDIEYKLIAIVKTNGHADIHEFDVEYWDELPPMIGAKRLDAIRTQPLYDLTKKMRYLNYHITAWVDNMGLLKDLPMNPIGCKLYPGPIAGDMILTLEDNKYNPTSFESIDDLKKIIAELGAKLDNIYLDDAPDDDGRYDAWS